VQDFIARHRSKIIGVLRGFDRIVFRGCLSRLLYPEGVAAFLNRQGCLLKDFGHFVQETTGALRDLATAAALRLGRPVHYLESSSVSKEEVARKFFRESPVKKGLVCMLSCVEPCTTWQVFRSREKKSQELRRKWAKCLHHYFYLIDPDFGWMHVRVQTWMPYTVQICMNGREWLGRQMDRVHLRHERADNCFLSIKDPDRAQQIFDGMLTLPWDGILNRFVAQVQPSLLTIADHAEGSYYWTLHQCEFATDVMFKSPDDLARLYGGFARHAISDLGSRDTMRFLGKPVVSTYRGEVVTDYKHRPEGICVRHRCGKNSIKMYDKMGSVLRIETTTNDPSEFKRRRRASGDPASPMKWRPLRKGLADLKPRAQASDKANAAYLQDLATVSDDKKVSEIVSSVLGRTQLGNRNVRALRPWSDPDLPLLRAINRGDFITNGFRNKDLVPILFPAALSDPAAGKKAAAKVTRLLRILRAHGVVERVEGTHRYVVTAFGRRLVTAVLSTLDAPISQLRRSA
jgi:hypothetical protein